VFVGWITKEGGATKTENQNQKSNMEFFSLTFLQVLKKQQEDKRKTKDFKLIINSRTLKQSTIMLKFSRMAED